VDSVFPSHESAYEILSSQWLRTRDQFPVFGVAQAIALLESELKIPEEKSPLKKDLPPPMDPEDYFSPKN
jgi:hypothetical protein